MTSPTARRAPMPPDPGRPDRRLDPNLGWVLPGRDPPVADQLPGESPLPRSAMVRATVVLVLDAVVPAEGMADADGGPSAATPGDDHAHARPDEVVEQVRAVLGRDDEVVLVDARGVATPAALTTDASVHAATDHPRVRRVELASARPHAWALGLGIQHARGRILVVPDTLADAVVVADQHDVLGDRGVLVAEVRVPASGDAPARAVGTIGWRDAVLGRVGFPDADHPESLPDWRRRLAAALVPAARTHVDVDSPSPPARGDDVAVDHRREPDTDGEGTGSIDPGRVAFPPRRDHVSVTLASFPPRRPHLRRVVATLLPQVDLLGVHLNNYEDVPDFLDHPRIVVSHSRDLGDLRDNGKAAFTDVVPDGYHLLADDDLDYPDDYVVRLVAKVEQFDRRAVVGHHGVLVDLPVTGYFGHREVLHFTKALPEDRRVHLLGTGTVAMHTDTLRLGLDDLPTTGMVDIWLAVAASRRDVPLVAVARPRRYLRPLEQLGDTLFDEYRHDDHAHVEALQALDLPPLG